MSSSYESSSLTATRPLPAALRCDRCGARAAVQADLPNGGTLLFCGHHGRAHETSLRRGNAELHTLS